MCLWELRDCSTTCGCKGGHQVPVTTQPDGTLCSIGVCSDGYCRTVTPTDATAGDSEVSDVRVVPDGIEASDVSAEVEATDGG
jgi:hypothetical protein